MPEKNKQNNYLKYLNRRKLVRGVGINDADYAVSPKINGKAVHCPFYSIWSHMLDRCYSDKNHKMRPSNKKCSVVKKWHKFSNFKRWMEQQNWQGKELDKDIIVPGNKIYGPNTCVFVSKELNSLLGSCKSRRGKYAQGVCFDIQCGRFKASISKFGEGKSIGLFSSEKEAEIAYLNEKRLYILDIVRCEPDVRIKQGLYRHIVKLEKKGEIQ